jgi:prepilin-type processing-associated H-X9-DG protein
MRVKALLSSYLGIPNISGTSDVRLAKGVYRCPSWVNKSSLGSAAQSGYAWNYSYLGYESGAWPVPQVKLAQVRRPSETIDFADTLDQEATGYGICNYLMMTYPNQAAVFSPNLSVGERHALGGDYLWLDAHVSWISARTAMVGKNGDGNYCYKVVK